MIFIFHINANMLGRLEYQPRTAFIHAFDEMVDEIRTEQKMSKIQEGDSNLEMTREGIILHADRHPKHAIHNTG